MSTNNVGNISEAAVLGAYMRAGFYVSVPFGNGCAYDLIVDTGERLLKVQVKTGWLCKGCLLFKGRRRIRDSKQNGMRKYRKGEVDYFAVYYPPAGAIYVVPLGVMGVDGCLRLEPVLNGQQKFIRWAADYTWERHVEELLREGAL
ncbi:MAG TPA: group I intron-associated PD-(D/E)XK endonuclease [Pyrinomonadaceae bacterium]|nr:group I intron-associated PD-(D/E)XK endonuclease [Pyrinomonadaceae bacterium]